MSIRFISFISLSCLLISCVKDPTEIAPDHIFNINVDGKTLEDMVFLADNTTRYSFEVKASNGVAIDNDKQVTVAVSDGTVASATTIGSTPSAQTVITVQGGKVNFFYIAGRKAKNSALMTFTIDGISEIYHFDISPSEPDDLDIQLTPALPKVGDAVKITVTLVKTGPIKTFASEDLKIDFDVKKADNSSIVPFINGPSFAYSVYVDPALITAGTNISTNREKGKVVITAAFHPTNGTDLIKSSEIEFIP